MSDREPTTGTGVTRLVIGALVLAAVFVIVAAQNSDPVQIDVLLWELNPPLYGVAVVSALFGAAGAEALAGIWRHRRLLRNRERRELDALRRQRRRSSTPAETAAGPEPADRPASPGG